MMADPFSKPQSVPAKTAHAPASKQPAPANKDTNAAPPKQVSYGLLALIVGSVALSLYSVPFLLVRILAVLLSLGGIGLAALQFRTNEKKGRNLNAAIAGTMFSAAVIVLMAVGPYLPTPGPRMARAQVTSSKSPSTHTAPAESVPQTTKPAERVSRTTNNELQPAQPPTQTTAATDEKPNEVPQIPGYVPKTVPFPCRKSFQLLPSGTGEWVDATTSAVGQGEIGVCVASAAIEQLEISRTSTAASSPKDNLVIHLQVMLVGTTGKVDFQSWSNSNYGDTRNKPTLTNNSTNVPLRTFDVSTVIPGHERPKGLYPKLYADDYLIFEKPNPIADNLRLELPASAFGGVGTLRFQIPKSMIDGK